MSEPSPTQPTDAELITRSVGDIDEFGILYDRHIEAVLRFHYSRTGSPHVAADLTAETFASAFSSRRRFRDTGAPGRAWLFKIARRQLSHYLRREEVATRARRRLAVDTTSAIDDSDIELIEQLADLRWVRDAVGDLPPNLSEAVWLRGRSGHRGEHHGIDERGQRGPVDDDGSVEHGAA